jgi:epoxyqueuosine reductase
VCPFNRFAPDEALPDFYPADWQDAAPALIDLLWITESEFARRYATSPIKRIKRERLVRNACVAAGNWGDEAAVAPLVALLADPSPLVRGHAAWALSRIGGEIAKEALQAALGAEADERVKWEMREGTS